MAKIRCGKWGCWIPRVGVLLSLFAPIITAQPPGFLSIRCGGKTNYSEVNNITWVTDAAYIDVGDIADIGNATTLGSPLDSLRLFRKPLNKSCYQLPVPSNVPYLIRLWFAVGNYNGFQTLPTFAYSLETVDMLAVENITAVTGKLGYYDAKIMATSGTVMYVCLIRTSENDDPFISGIELRPLKDGMYAQAKPGTMLDPRARVDVGGNSTFRYPQDNFDRVWTSNINLDSSDANLIRWVHSEDPISTTNTKELPPTAAMQTAWVRNGSDYFKFSPGSAGGRKSILHLFFAEIETLNISESRSFFVAINGVIRSENITLPRNRSAVELTFASNQFDYFVIQKAANSTRPPIINAYEYYWLHDTQPATYSQDIEALDVIKNNFDIKDWISDPCYVIQWKGIGCVNSPSAIRISEIDLSGRNLTGSLPKDIEQLTAIVNLSLNNNYLMGSLPDLSNLIMLERLNLGNNNLSGTVPDWLSQLKNLRELNIENNNFSGVIPPQLLLNCSLKFNYSGNRYLRMDKRECVPHNSNKNKLVVILGPTFSGILIVAIVGIVVCRYKVGRKEHGDANKSADCSIIIVPNTTNSRAFTLQEIVTATQNYNRKIGEGGFGSVFLGKLPEGRDIAVKVLSLFSRQGAREFLNEVDLLSRINHRNLVSLLGYCNETREVMLIYEYMPGGSLRDHLYGRSSEESKLSWKTRLRIDTGREEPQQIN